MGKFGKGLNRDSNPIDQPEGTWRYAKNAVVKKELGGISNESGTTSTAAMQGSGDYTFIGKIEISSDFVILFSVLNASSRGEIGIFQGDVYTVLLNMNPASNPTADVNLNFNILKLISGTFKYNTLNELIIYWTDNNNPPRTLNVTQQKLSPSTLIYNKLVWTNYNISYISIIEMFPNAGTSPVVSDGVVVSGGAVSTAAYNLALAYKTEDGTSTNYIYISNTIHINDEARSGGLERSDGALSNIETGKAIKWVLLNYNNSYEYIQPVILKRTETTLEAFELPIIKLYDASGVYPPSINITYTAVESIIPISSDDVLIDNISYSTVRDLTLLEDRLYGANLTSDVFPDYQPYANYIATNAATKWIGNFEALYLTENSVNQGGAPPFHETASYKNLDKDVLPIGYKRGDVYAFYIAFILKDGSMSKAFHIPGRADISTEKNTYSGITNKNGGEFTYQEYMNGDSLYNYEVSDYVGSAGSLNMNFWENKDGKYPGTSSWEIIDATNILAATAVSTIPLVPSNGGSGYNWPPNLAATTTCNNNGTGLTITMTIFGGIITGITLLTAGSGYAAGDIITVTGGGGIGGIFTVLTVGQINIKNEKVRHHRFPQNGEGNGFNYDQGQTITTGNVLDLNNNLVSEPDVVRGVVHKAAILGFTLDKLKIPHTIAKRIQGFEIFRAKRKHFDKTSIGQGLAMPMLRSKRTNKSNGDNPQKVWSPVPLPWSGMVEGTHGSYNSPGNSLGAGLDYRQNGVSFHDFTLLREKLSIKQADYLQYQARVIFKMYVGPWDDYTPGGASHQALITGYGVAQSHNSAINKYPFLIHKGAKTYVPGRSFYRVDTNFGVEAINNIGGNSKIALHLSTPLPIVNTTAFFMRYELPIFGTGTWSADQPGASPASADKNILLTSGTNFNYGGSSYFQDHTLILTDLKSFKRNVYIDFMERSLVSTGYRVTGPELQRFLVDSSNNPLGSHPDDLTGIANFTTDKIFGGDTFISRHTFRPTWDTGARVYGGLLVRSASVKGLYSYITESSDNIGMQHSEGIGTAFANTYFPKQLLWTWEKTCLSTLSNWDSGGVWDPINDDWYTTCECLDLTAHKTATHPGDTKIGILAGDPEGIRYNNMYSMENDIKTPRPKSFYEIEDNIFPTRVIRSKKGGTVSDSNRIFSALDFIDVNKNTGDVNNIITLHNQLFIHTENGMYKTIGKQKMETSGGSAFIGSGDIFAQVPENILQTDLGYGGNQSLYSSVVSRYGYFWIDLKNKKVMSFTDKLEVISDIGMSTWFKHNLPDYSAIDTPYAQNGIHMEEDIINRRLLITRVSDNIHFPHYNWTISYQLDYKQWVSFHDYIPNMYLYVKGWGGDSFLYSIFNHASGATPYNSINRHSHDIFDMCKFNGTIYNFEFEYVDQVQQESSKVYSNIFYNIEARSTQQAIQHHTGFTSLYVYNNQQTSGLVDISYLQNTRKNEGSWFVSGFRDMSAELLDTTYSGTNNYLGVNLPGTISTGNTDMFNGVNVNIGMNQNANPAYLDMAKDWTRRGTFIDKYLNIRLISDNSDNLLVTLYFAGATKRLSYR